MKVVVTGGAGFIGANLCRTLVERPEVGTVVVLDNLSTGYAANLRGVPVAFVEGSILDQPLLHRVVDGADAVVHLAARPSVARSLDDPMASHEANATGSLNVLEASRRAGAYVVTASSSSVYGSTPVLPKNEDLPTRPLSPYAASKLAAEAYALSYAASFDVPLLALRFFNVYGPLQSSGHAYAAVIPTFVDAALRGEPVRVHGDGRQTRDFTYVGSVCEVLADAVTRRVTADVPVNLAFGGRVSVVDLVAHLSTLLGGEIRVEHVAPRRGDVRDSQADNTRLRALFPHIQPVPFAGGLGQTVDWFRGLPQYAGPAASMEPAR